MRKIKLWKDPYNTGYSVCDKEELELVPGVTVLVGCNGSGKTTILNNIYEHLKTNKIPTLRYNNLTDNNPEDNIKNMVLRYTSSEGENISINLGTMLSKIKSFMKSETESNERWLLLDAVDSGYSIDNIIDLKGVFELIIRDAESLNIDFYIIISANEYELVDNSNCLDVTTGEYIKFKDYKEYKDFILATRTKKNNRFKE